MAVIKGKDLNNLEDWNDKELRKLKINLNNRISSLKVKESELSENNPLHGLDLEGCKGLLERVFKRLKAQ